VYVAVLSHRWTGLSLARRLARSSGGDVSPIRPRSAPVHDPLPAAQGSAVKCMRRRKSERRRTLAREGAPPRTGLPLLP